ncbi:hypothetical protein K227x_14150 [Rubripirellula lacrimiformis]|uniref:Uncharacterized protein n=2 Tax=Rubripirellula lacrimiformis TaxID=1930273 RepID=A0A517N7B4_9BACT|nr:hypothetical protein K227x_14150 [Rubripirellula lacrimiformis]
MRLAFELYLRPTARLPVMSHPFPSTPLPGHWRCVVGLGWMLALIVQSPGVIAGDSFGEMRFDQLIDSGEGTQTSYQDAQSSIPVGQYAIEPEIFQADTRQPDTFQAATPLSWTVSGQFLTLDRNDSLNLAWAGGQNRSTKVQSGMNSGVRVALERRVGSPSADGGSLVSWSFLATEGDDAFGVRSDEMMASSELYSFAGHAGVFERTLDGDISAAFGIRYLQMMDRYDVRYSSGFVYNDFTATENHVLVAEGKYGGQWQWNPWLSFDAGLAGGVGGAYSRREGFWSHGPAARYDVSETGFVITSEFAANVRLDFRPRTSFQFGFYGLTISDIATARRSYAKPGDTESARYAGLSFGLRHQF